MSKSRQTENTVQVAALNHDLQLLDHYNPQTDRLSVTRKRFNGRCLTVLKRTTSYFKKLWDALVEKIRHFFCSYNYESDYINNILQHRGMQQELIDRIHNLEGVDTSNNAFIYIQNHLPRFIIPNIAPSRPLRPLRIRQELPEHLLQAPHTLFLSGDNDGRSSSTGNRSNLEEHDATPHASVRPEDEDIYEEDFVSYRGSIISETSDDHIPVISLDTLSDLSASDEMFIAFMNGDGEMYGHTRASVKGSSHDQLIASYGSLRHLILPNPVHMEISGGEVIPMTPSLIRVLSDPVNKTAVDCYIIDMIFETMLPTWGITVISLDNYNHLSEFKFYLHDREKAAHLLLNAGPQANTINQILAFLNSINYFDLAKSIHRLIQSYRKSQGVDVNFLWVMAVFQGGPQEQRADRMKEMAQWLAFRPDRKGVASQAQSTDSAAPFRRRQRLRKIYPEVSDFQRPSTSFRRMSTRAWVDSLQTSTYIETAVQSEEQRASSMLDGFGLELIPTRRNGNCCFEAISKQSDNIPIQNLRQELLQGALELAQMLDCHYGHNTITTLSEEEQQYVNSWLSDDVGGSGVAYLRARREPDHDMCYTKDGAYAYADDIYIFARRLNRPFVIGDMRGNLLGLSDNNGHVLPYSNKSLNDDVVTGLPNLIYLIFNGHNHFMGARHKINEDGDRAETTTS